MTQQLTKIKFPMALPGSTQGSFALPVPVPFVPLTVLKSYGLPGFPYGFAAIAQAQLQTALFSGKVANVLSWQAEVVGVEELSPPSSTLYTVIGSNSLPIFPYKFSAFPINVVDMMGKVAGTLNWQALLLGMEGNILSTKQFCQQNDVGVQLVYQFVDQDLNPLNIQGASSIKLKIGYPDGTTLDRSATFLSNGSDGKIYYITIGGDLPQVGLHTVQGKYVLGSQNLSGQEVALEVLQNVDNN